MERRSDSGGNDALERALDQAIAGDDRALFLRLTRGSALPGVRPNTTLLTDFARLCKVRGPRADALVLRMATLSADAAPGATELEFLPMCGVAAVGARAAADPTVRERMVRVLHDASEDLRFRVRDLVPEALGRIGEQAGDEFATKLGPWMDGFFQASAVLRALAHPGWISGPVGQEAALTLLEAAFVLARDAERAAARYPGHKALVEALSSSPGALAQRLGVPVFDLLVRWSQVKDPVLREAIAKNLEGTRLASRYATEVTRVRQALEGTAPERRDPRTYVGPTRGRGRKKAR